MNVFHPQMIQELFHDFPLSIVLGVLAGAFLLTFYLIPKILWVIKEKNLLKPVIDRSAHSVETPSFGGVAFFMTLVLVISMFQSFQMEPVGNHFIAGLTILFMVGIKDDLVVSTARAKLLGQLIAIFFIIFSPELAVTNLHGFLGFYHIPIGVGYLISTAFMILIINGYNLIDGINGLAGIIGIIICASFGLYFYLLGSLFYIFLCVTVIGILLAFLRYNLSRGKNKIFMGDSGSLIIGFIIGFLALKVLTMPTQPFLHINGFIPANRVPFVLAILFVPLFDTFRVIYLRIANGRSPMQAGQDHSHHLLLQCGMSHVQASILLGAINIGVIALFIWLLQVLNNSVILFACTIGIFLLFFFIFQVLAKIGVERIPSFKEAKTSSLRR
ncbi:MAG TPA: MraY family glycosyltransferase [Aequorivita sp.]|nr:MraY family glycosyltransferase [Aequorivita sp.]